MCGNTVFSNDPLGTLSRLQVTEGAIRIADVLAERHWRCSSLPRVAIKAP